MGIATMPLLRRARTCWCGLPQQEAGWHDISSFKSWMWKTSTCKNMPTTGYKPFWSNSKLSFAEGNQCAVKCGISTTFRGTVRMRQRFKLFMVCLLIHLTWCMHLYRTCGREAMQCGHVCRVMDTIIYCPLPSTICFGGGQLLWRVKWTMVSMHSAVYCTWPAIGGQETTNACSICRHEHKAEQTPSPMCWNLAVFDGWSCDHELFLL